jgi:hypothetical protein
MNVVRCIGVAVCVAVTSTVASASVAAASAAARPAWAEFWQSVHVDPPPPETFLVAPPFHGKILNLTGGRLTDEVVKQWVYADLRRGHADAWASNNLRRDIADAGVLGPAGLNGTTESIVSERAKDVVRIDADGYAESVAVGVIWLSKQEQGMNPGAEYTDFVIVSVRRMTGKQRTRVFKDGTRTPFGKTFEAGHLNWQLDTGHFVNHRVLGPLWYQQAGWSCDPGDDTQMAEICGRVKP